MKILCVADYRSPLVYSLGIKERFKNIDLILGAGDLPLDYYGYIVSNLNKMLYFVFGNHNLKHYKRFTTRFSPFENQFNYVAKQSFGSILLSGKSKRVKKNGPIIVGMGGSIKYNKGLNQYTDLEMYLKIFKLIPILLLNKIRHKRYVDIFLAHSPPFGLNDTNDPCHRGFKAFVWFIKKFKPQYFIHGHVHLYDINTPRELKYKSTTIINVYEKYTLEWENPSG